MKPIVAGLYYSRGPNAVIRPPPPNPPLPSLPPQPAPLPPEPKSSRRGGGGIPGGPAEGGGDPIFRTTLSVAVWSSQR